MGNIEVTVPAEGQSLLVLVKHNRQLTGLSSDCPDINQAASCRTQITSASGTPCFNAITAVIVTINCLISTPYSRYDKSGLVLRC